MHGSKDRAKDASSITATIARCRVHTLGGACRRRSPPRRPSDIRCHRRALDFEGIPEAELRTDRGPLSDDAPRRAAPSRRPGCLSPSRTRRMYEREGMAPSGLRSGALAHAAHTVPEKGIVLWLGIASLTGRSPAVRDSRECRRLCDSLAFLRAWAMTTQARQRARSTRPSTRTVCLARTDVGRSASTASTTESSWPEIGRAHV